MIAQANAAPPQPILQTMSSGKGDLLEVNRSSKSSMLMDEPAAQKKRSSLGRLIDALTGSN
jgi:hypothetical protein